jgi:CRISPR/Cas system type I-B associated protein Csh2 (Cas7 group RAMP superfamily)
MYELIYLGVCMYQGVYMDIHVTEAFKQMLVDMYNAIYLQTQNNSMKNTFAAQMNRIFWKKHKVQNETAWQACANMYFIVNSSVSRLVT